MINKDKWINSIPKSNNTLDESINQINHEKWRNTIPQKETYNSVRKYSFMTIIFVFGLLFVSIVKNETRNLEKEIYNLKASIRTINFNLDQASLDNEVITSPENISLLAKEHLNINLVSYKKSQIKDLDIKNKKNSKVKNLKSNLSAKVKKSIKEKKVEINKLKDLYTNPKAIPEKAKTEIAKKIQDKKEELKQMYNSPKDTVNLKKVSKWGAMQVVKVFLGMPVVPGR